MSDETTQREKIVRLLSRVLGNADLFSADVVADAESLRKDHGVQDWELKLARERDVLQTSAAN